MSCFLIKTNIFVDWPDFFIRVSVKQDDLLLGSCLSFEEVVNNMSNRAIFNINNVKASKIVLVGHFQGLANALPAARLR